MITCPKCVELEAKVAMLRKAIEPFAHLETRHFVKTIDQPAKCEYEIFIHRIETAKRAYEQTA